MKALTDGPIGSGVALGGVRQARETVVRRWQQVGQ